ncbi:hypothetical protein J4526_08500 [Desulfurococcaceae archaeon MEX13E-LK6-19]|nr:hypothetical protein J4526_08500 [Desulfurococcaceae archaeon MEX13E-LK6-19]
MKTMLFEENAFHVILVYNNGSDSVATTALAKLYEIAVKGYRRFIIHVISPMGKPYYVEKLRDLISNNIAYTLIIKYRGPNVEDLASLAHEVKDKPHLVLVSHDMIEYYNVALTRGLSVEKIS